jgi:Rhodopirellula transposase DDE domain
MDDASGIRARFTALAPLLDEKSRRLLAAAESKAWGPGGTSAVSRATGVSRRVIQKGILELEGREIEPKGRLRRPGGGRKKSKQTDPTLVADLERLVGGEADSSLSWTCKSVRRLAEELGSLGHKISYPVVAELLREMGYVLEANRKTKTGEVYLDRNAQFQLINDKVQYYAGEGLPVISVAIQKKGPIANLEELITENGWSGAVIDRDTASVAVEAVRRWWHATGAPLYPRANRLLITTSSASSNETGLLPWKLALWALADEIGISIAVSHLPPGTSKWKKIERVLTFLATRNWLSQPAAGLRVTVSLIGGATGLAGVVKGLEGLDLGVRGELYGEWNYEVS